MGRRGPVAGAEARWARAADRTTGAASDDFDENVFVDTVDIVACGIAFVFAGEKKIA